MRSFIGGGRPWLLAVTLLFAVGQGCAPDGGGGQDRGQGTGTQTSRYRVSLPNPYLPGYVADLKGEILQYHSPVPMIGTSLLVRSEDQGRSIAWESAPIPADFQGEAITLALMIGIDVNDEPRSFDFRVGGQELFQVRNPLEAALGDTLVWEGEGGVRGEFQVTLMDRYGDAMGFLFLTLPASYLTPGEPVAFEVVGESAGARTWFMVFRDSLEPRMELQNAPAVLRTLQGEAQVLRLDLLSLEGDQPFHLNSPIGTLDTVAGLGHTRLILPVPAVTEPEPVKVDYALGDIQGSFTYAVTPPRRMEVYLLHHTHLDIGYTHHQDEVERIQWSHLEEALRLGEASQDYPDGERFIWNPEGLWAVEGYLANHPGEKAEALLEGIRRGWIRLDGMYAGLLTGLANEETLHHTFDAARKLAQVSGVPIESAMLSDIPGFSWGLVEALNEAGIRYLSIGPNFGHRIGHFTEALGDKPFWWEGPSGESRVLTWVSGGGYAWFHTGLGYDSITAQLNEEKLFNYLDQLFSGDYPYDMTYLRYNIGSDNGPPDPGLADAVRRWNERYASPVLRISGTAETFRTFESRYGLDLPTMRGDLTGHWEDGAASSARETAMVRRVAEALPQTEKLAELRGVVLDSVTLARAWRDILLYYEHTWGSWNSVSEPYAELTVTSWERKKAFAEEAERLAEELRRAALAPETKGGGVAEGEDRIGAAAGSGSGEVGGRADLPGAIPEHSVLEVINTLSWPRTDLVTLSPALSRAGDRVTDQEGRPVPSQRLRSGELAFLVQDLPGEAARTYLVGPGHAFNPEGIGLPEEPSGGPSLLEVATSVFSVFIDSATGDIRSLRHRPSGRDLVSDTVGGLNQYLYVPGRDPAEAVSSGGAEITLEDAGPLVWTVTTEAPAPGLRGPLRRSVTLVEGLEKVRLTNVVLKEWVLDPEAVLFRFPFAFEAPEVRIDGPFGPYRLEVDQLPGGNRNYCSLQRWVDLSEADWGLTMTSIDAPLLQFGEIETDAIVTGWLDEAQVSPILFSYVMNNYWETNYRAAQDDEVAFNYALRPHGSFHAEEARRFGFEEARPLVVRVSR